MGGTQRMIANRYRLIHPIAEGGFGRVWKAHDEVLRADVVVKEVLLPLAADPDEQARRLMYAEREARNAARLRHHPGILPVYDVVTADGRPWIVMELIDGSSLEERLSTEGPLSMTKTAEIADTLLKALDAAHSAKVVHRDVKPANVMLAADGRILLTDFGIATYQVDTRLTTDGSVIGSLEYIAPERLNGVSGTPASDLFSLGVTLYRTVEGVSPFLRDSPQATLTAVLREDPRPCSEPEDSPRSSRHCSPKTPKRGRTWPKHAPFYAPRALPGRPRPRPRPRRADPRTASRRHRPASPSPHPHPVPGKPSNTRGLEKRTLASSASTKALCLKHASGGGSPVCGWRSACWRTGRPTAWEPGGSVCVWCWPYRRSDSWNAGNGQGSAS